MTYIKGINGIAKVKNISHVWMPDKTAIIIAYDNPPSFSPFSDKETRVRIDFATQEEAQNAMEIIWGAVADPQKVSAFKEQGAY